MNKNNYTVEEILSAINEINDNKSTVSKINEIKSNYSLNSEIPKNTVKLIEENNLRLLTEEKIVVLASNYRNALISKELEQLTLK